MKEYIRSCEQFNDVPIALVDCEAAIATLDQKFRKGTIVKNVASVTDNISGRII